MSGSPADALSRGIERSKQLLFPARFEKWATLGFTVFLAQLGEVAGGFSLRFPSLPGSSGSGSSNPLDGSGFRELWEKVRDELPFWIGIAAGVFVLVLLIGIALLWVSSRAKLMFVESVIWDRVDFGRQWSTAGSLAPSLFKFSLLLSLGGQLLLLGGLTAAGVLAFPDLIRGEWFGPQALVGYGTFAGVLLLVGVPLWIASALLSDFVAPLMVIRNVPVSPAWGMAYREVIRGNVGSLLVFYVLKALVGSAVALVAMLLSCVTCCLASLPYVSTVVLLPAHVFFRAFSLHFMETLGIPVFPKPEVWTGSPWQFPA